MDHIPVEIKHQIIAAQALDKHDKQALSITSRALQPIANHYLYNKLKIIHASPPRQALSYTYRLLLCNAAIAEAVREFILVVETDGSAFIEPNFWNVLPYFVNLSSLKLIGEFRPPAENKRLFFDHVKKLKITHLRLLYSGTSINDHEDSFPHLVSLIVDTEFESECPPLRLQENRLT